MNMHVSINYDETSLTYQSVTMKQGQTVTTWATGNVVLDWYEMVRFASRQDGFLLVTSSLTHFLMDVPGYRTIVRDEGEFIIIDDREDSPRPDKDQFDQSFALVLGWNINVTKAGRDVSFRKGDRRVWKTDEGVWMSAEFIDQRLTNHQNHEQVDEALLRW